MIITIITNILNHWHKKSRSWLITFFFLIFVIMAERIILKAKPDILTLWCGKLLTCRQYLFKYIIINFRKVFIYLNSHGKLSRLCRVFAFLTFRGFRVIHICFPLHDVFVKIITLAKFSKVYLRPWDSNC